MTLKHKIYLLLLIQVCVNRVMLKLKATPSYHHYYRYIHVNKLKKKKILFGVMYIPISYHNDLLSLDGLCMDS